MKTNTRCDVQNHKQTESPQQGQVLPLSSGSLNGLSQSLSY